MYTVRRQLFLGAVLAATTGIATTAIIGDQGGKPASSLAAFPQNLSKLSERFAEGKFLEAGVHTYATASGEQTFALKLQPNLASQTSSGKTDILFLVDSTASQAGMPWLTAKALTKQLSEKFGSEDRVAIASVAGKLTQHTGFVSAKDAKVTAGLKGLNDVTPMGCADLKSALTSVNNLFDGSNDRRKVIVYIGDGVSALSPMQAADRNNLASTMLSKEIQFFVVPVGMKPDVLDMSGIASMTGGAVLRLANQESPEATTARFHKSLTAPVLRNVEVQLPAEVTLALPGKLPPLRGDQPTLGVGEFKGKLNQFSVTCKGTVEGKPVSVTQTEPVLTSTPDCFFLPSMVRQWKQDQDAPALVRGDLALVFASSHNNFAKGDLLTQAAFAVKGNQLDLAAQLFNEAAR
ncbi:MAG TPA: VWA domain-containing protein, partial [Gemmatales bacterium]|nr:VWA domain-containing protein [Gemmatales bacterium]